MADINWREIRANFSGANQAMAGASQSMSQAGDIFSKMRAQIAADRQADLENAFREKQLAEQMRQFDVTSDLSKEQFTYSQKNDALNRRALAIENAGRININPESLEPWYTGNVTGQGSTPNSYSYAIPKQAEQYLDIYTKAAEANGIDRNLLMAVNQIESNFNPRAVNAKSGAAGMGQIMPSNFEAYGITDPYDPVQNINASAKMLGELSRANNGDLDTILADYNWGQGNRAKYGMEARPTETLNYTNNIRNLLGIPNDSNLPRSVSGQNADIATFNAMRAEEQRQHERSREGRSERDIQNILATAQSAVNRPNLDAARQLANEAIQIREATSQSNMFPDRQIEMLERANQLEQKASELAQSRKVFASPEEADLATNEWLINNGYGDLATPGIRERAKETRERAKAIDLENLKTENELKKKYAEQKNTLTTKDRESYQRIMDMGAKIPQGTFPADSAKYRNDFLNTVTKAVGEGWSYPQIEAALTMQKLDEDGIFFDTPGQEALQAYNERGKGAFQVALENTGVPRGSEGQKTTKTTIPSDEGYLSFGQKAVAATIGGGVTGSALYGLYRGGKAVGTRAKNYLSDRRLSPEERVKAQEARQAESSMSKQAKQKFRAKALADKATKRLERIEAKVANTPEGKAILESEQAMASKITREAALKKAAERTAAENTKLAQESRARNTQIRKDIAELGKKNGWTGVQTRLATQSAIMKANGIVKKARAETLEYLNEEKALAQRSANIRKVAAGIDEISKGGNAKSIFGRLASRIPGLKTLGSAKVTTPMSALSLWLDMQEVQEMEERGLTLSETEQANELRRIFNRPVPRTPGV